MIVYYYILYLKVGDKIEIHLKPFDTKEEAENYRKNCDKHFGDRVYHSRIRRTDLSKSDKGLWIR